MSNECVVTLSKGVRRDTCAQTKLVKPGEQYKADLSCGSYRVFYEGDKFFSLSKKKFQKLFDRV